MSEHINHKAEIYKAADGWRWRLRAHNGKVVADGSEAYASKGNARQERDKGHTVLRRGGQPLYLDELEPGTGRYKAEDIACGPACEPVWADIETPVTIGDGEAASVMTATACWTCGAEIAPQVWRLAPREPEPNDHLRVCVDCHDTIEFLGGDRPLRIANMIRFAAGIPTVAPLHSGRAIAPDEPQDNGSKRDG